MLSARSLSLQLLCNVFPREIFLPLQTGDLKYQQLFPALSFGLTSALTLTFVFVSELEEQSRTTVTATANFLNNSLLMFLLNPLTSPFLVLLVISGGKS